MSLSRDMDVVVLLDCRKSEYEHNAGTVLQHSRSACTSV
jgi:hypothetical protein